MSIYSISMDQRNCETPENENMRQYLERLDRGLIGRLPTSERIRLGRETLDHLSMVIEDFEAQGLGTEDATERAIKEYGEELEMAEDYVRAWFEQPAYTGRILSRIGRAQGIAYAVCSLATLIFLLFIQFRIYFPSGNSIIDLPYSVAELRNIFPEPLPFPDMTSQFFFMVGYPLLAPFVVGWLCAKLIPVRPHAAFYSAMVPIMLFTYLIGTLLLPATEPLLFAVSLTIFWLPVGYAVAYLVNKRARSANYGHR